MEKTVSTIEHDIERLTRELKERQEALLREKAIGDQGHPSEKEILHGIIGERIQEHAPEYQFKTPQAKSQAPAEVDSSDPLTPEQRAKLEEAVALAMKNLEEGIKKAASYNNQALLDEFHDVVTDDKHDQLVQVGQLEEID